MLIGTDNPIINDNAPVSYTNVDSFADRINVLIDVAGSGSEFARKCGVSDSVIRKWRNGESDPSRRRLLTIAEAFNVDLIWLASGEGEMRRGRVSNSIQQHVINDVKGENLEERNDFALIPMYDVEASAGHGAVVGEELQISQLAFRKDWLKSKGLQQNKLATIKTKGDSMEPTLYDGDLLLVDTRIEKIIGDSIYIINADQHLIVKRLQQSLDGSIAIISDNQRYEKQRLNPEQGKALKIAGRVCWYGHEI